MILWIALFILVVVLSFVLAAKSMRDYQEVPSERGDYGLFLIRNRGGLTAELFHSIHDELLSSGLSISFERVFKGKESALLVFGPRILLAKFNQILSLLELEDYTNIDIDTTLAWEIGINSNTEQSEQKIFSQMPQLLDQEQFWWQLVLWVSSKSFHGQIRAVLKSEDPLKRKNISQILQNLPHKKLVKLPKAFSNSQLMDFYKKRSFQKKVKGNSLNSVEIMQLISI